MADLLTCCSLLPRFALVGWVGTTGGRAFVSHGFTVVIDKLRLKHGTRYYIETITGIRFCGQTANSCYCRPVAFKPVVWLVDRVD